MVTYILITINIILCVYIVIKTTKSNKETLFDYVKKEILDEQRATRQELISFTDHSFKNMSEVLTGSQKSSADSLDKRFESFAVQNEQKLENIRTTVERRLQTIQEDNNKKLEEMRKTVDEKLQKTLEDKLGQSFKLVSDRLEQVYKGLGEMQTLANGVGDLKKVLSNVKTRGILGEIQLGAILEEILATEQYLKNVVTKKGSKDPVEFAIKFPGDDENGCVLLPIDAKFPADAYSDLVDAYDSADKTAVDTCGAVLDSRIKKFAKDISEKYISPPYTTDFAIMFLPFEGLYAEVARRGLIEKLQRDYKVNIAGPSTMAALLNSLQMGFKTLAIQKRSGEVWNILAAVKNEFETFATVLANAQTKIEQANSDLDKLVGVRTRKIQAKLRSVSSLPEEQSRLLIEE